MLGCVPAATAAIPQTLVTSTQRIAVFEQDGNTISWATYSRGVCGRTTIQSLLTGATTVLGSSQRPVCLPQMMALGGRQTLWTSLLGSGNGWDDWLFHGRLGSPAFRRIGSFKHLAGGRWLTAMEGDGRTLVFAWADVIEEMPMGDCFCFWALRGGAVEAVVDGRRKRVPTAPASALVAVSAGRVALAPVAPSWQGSEAPRAAPNGPVEVRDVDTGAVISMVAPVGTVRALALSGNRLAALVSAAGGKRIDVWEASSGALLRSIVLPDRAAPDIDLAGRRLAWRAGRSIYVLDVETGASEFLFRSRLVPVGLSIEGRRVAWAAGRLIRSIVLES